MPRGRLSEKHVKQVAVEWLASYYRGRESVQAVVPETEAVVRAETRLGSGRADGLVAWQLSDGSVGTAAMEAKSWRTLSNLRRQYGNKRWALHALAAGGLGLLPAGLMGWYVGTWFWMWVVPMLVFFGVGLAYLLSTTRRSRYRLTDAIQQVSRYPADESWVAISADAYDRLHSEEQQALQAGCQREGIGLLKVQSVMHVTPLEEPRPRGVSKAHVDLLACYARSNVIRQKLRRRAGESKGRRTADPQPRIGARAYPWRHA